MIVELPESLLCQHRACRPCCLNVLALLHPGVLIHREPLGPGPTIIAHFGVSFLHRTHEGIKMGAHSVNYTSLRCVSKVFFCLTRVFRDQNVAYETV